MALPGFPSLMLPLLKLVDESGEGITRKELAAKMAEHFKLSEEERKETYLKSGYNRFKSRIGWASLYLVQAGLLERPGKGVLSITEEGKKILATKPDSIDKKFLLQFPPFKEWHSNLRKSKTKENQKPPSEASFTPEDTPEERINSAYEELFNTLKQEILERVLNSSPEFFEKLVVELLPAIGYGSSLEGSGKHLGKSGDGGIDGVIREDKLGLDVIYIQAKKYAKDKTVGRPDIQKFVGSLEGRRTNKGVFFTTASFSQGAVNYAKDVSHRLILIDGEQLAELMIKYEVGIRPEHVIELKKIDEDFFDD